MLCTAPLRLGPRAGLRSPAAQGSGLGTSHGSATLRCLGFNPKAVKPFSHNIPLTTACSAGDEPDVRDGKDLRRLALGLKIPIITTVAGARATTQALKGLKEDGPLTQTPLQAYFPDYKATAAALAERLRAYNV